ncbi:discoidin domain-containing protein [Nocardia sp. NPDC088792]|uniref:discoidin domain-containing protein n=1 Tax=Nocardia sp. NPDC088792 TaxID=3364332 RepID=UPI003801F247
MTDTDLIVPVKIHALVVNPKVRTSQPFMRWRPNFSSMINGKTSAEPEPYNNIDNITGDATFEGVHIQWELPEALTKGFIDGTTGDTRFPLVPNRWLVVRYTGDEENVAGWVIHSDYLERDDYSGKYGYGTSPYLSPRSTLNAPKGDWIGRAHDLSLGPWLTPETKELFLTAVGPGIPAFAAFQSYHQNVFSFHDTLDDRKGPSDKTVLSYTVIGWYSSDDADILTTTTNNPDLRLPATSGIDAVLAELGWTCPDDVPATVRHSLYAGTALGIAWDPDGDAPDSDMPDRTRVKVALGHSTADAAEALITHQTRSTGTGELIRALYHGTLDTYDGADGPTELDDDTHRSWFAAGDGGYIWQIADRPGVDTTPQAATALPQWLDTLNTNQAAYDTALHQLDHLQWRLWTLWWLHHLPQDQRPPNLEETFDETCERELNPNQTGSLAERTRAQQVTVTTLRASIPHGTTSAELQAAIDAYAAANNLPKTKELKRIPREAFHVPADPVVVLEGPGNTEPLTREDTLLPCRLPSKLLTEVNINGTWSGPPDQLPTPDLTGLPSVCDALIAEFYMLDKAARTSVGSDSTALHAILADPGLARGRLAEYTAPWRQPWLPMYLQWDLHYCPTPYRTDGQTHWTFNGDTYDWNGTGAPAGDDEGDLRFTVFRGRSFLTPTFTYTLRAQLARYLATGQATSLRAFRDEVATWDLLSQTLDGFNDWLLQHDGTARLVTDPSIAPLVGPTNYVPDPASTGTKRFQPVRAGQFFFLDLRVVDRFGRVMDIVNTQNYQQFPPVRAASVTPSKPLYTHPSEPFGKQRFIQLPPRILQDTRLRLEPINAVSGDTPLVGWLLINYLDRTLLIYAPDGHALGELRITAEKATSWTPLPHAPDTAQYPELSAFLTGLRAQPVAAFEALLDTIDEALDTIIDSAPDSDDSPVRLLGHPLALIRADLSLELSGPPLTDPSWDQVLTPPEATYPTYTWPVRLGGRERLTDGLIGYFSSDEVGGPVSYDHLHAVTQNSGSDYIRPIGTGTDLALPARPRSSEAAIRRIILLAEPHTPIHATTDILPVTTLTLDADTTHQALARMRASFRLTPLLAPGRALTSQLAATSMGVSGDYAPANMLDGDLTTFYWSGEWVKQDDWVAVDFASPQSVTKVDIYLGRPERDYLFETPFDLQYSTDGSSWTNLARYNGRDTTEVHYTPPSGPLTARALRVKSSGGQGWRVAIRSFEVTTDPPANAVVMPRPAAWHGSWTWAEPTDTSAWNELSILPADTQPHLGDPTPVARSGYLQLDPKPADAQS